MEEDKKTQPELQGWNLNDPASFTEVTSTYEPEHIGFSNEPTNSFTKSFQYTIVGFICTLLSGIGLLALFKVEALAGLQFYLILVSFGTVILAPAGAAVFTIVVFVIELRRLLKVD